MPDIDIKVDEALVVRLHRLFHLEDSDLAASQQFATRLLPLIEQASDEAFDYLLSFPELAVLYRSSEARQKMRLGQRTTFVELIAGRADEVYVRRNLQTGVVHEAAGIEPFGYLACYAYFTHRLLELTMVATGGFSREELVRVYQLMSKLVYLNIALAWQAYYKVKEQKIRDSYQALEASHNLSLRMIEQRDKEIEELLKHRQRPPESAPSS